MEFVATMGGNSPPNSFDVEGVILEDPDPQAGPGFDFDEYNVTVVVSDGYLTIKPGPGSANCKTMFLDILSTSPVSSSGKITTTWGGVKARC